MKAGKKAVLAAAACFAVCAGTQVFAQHNRNSAGSGQIGSTLPKDRHPSAAEAEPLPRADLGEEHETQSTHTLKLGGSILKYTANAGTLTVRNDQGVPQQSIFYVAYTLEAQAAAATRPVVFLFNGGPGTASIFLHIASFAPLRLRTTATGSAASAPFDFGPNPDTLLDVADLVFIDPPNAGYSRSLGDAKPAEYYSTDADIELFARAIQRYVTRYDRWNSPKFIFGESYGTTRAAALTYRLQQRGMAINGTVLLSSALNLGHLFGTGDLNHALFLPSFAAAAWYHDRVPGGRPGRLEDFVEEARQFALGPYLAALSKGQNLEAAELDRVAQQLTRFTGLPLEFIRRAKLRISPSGFRQALLREHGVAIGELDARLTAAEGDENAAEPWFDPSYIAFSKSIYGAFMEYMTHTLGFHSELNYNINAEWMGALNWSFAHKSPAGSHDALADTSADLAAALRTNTELRVLSLNGWYDLSTPFFGTEFDLSHMMLEPQAQRRITVRFYPAGHMAYLDPTAVHLMRLELGKFITAAP
jgi:carboxypeptidase C (cathepsin A)